MSSHHDTAAKPASPPQDWNETPQSPANDTASAPRIVMSTADAFGALADAVTAHINSPQRLKDRRAAVISLSERLREAFCIRARALAPLPLTLGSNHDAAADYIYDQLDRWGSQPALTDLFDTIGLAPDTRTAVISAAARRVPAEEIGVWLAKEFGALTASREAKHCRRYVATKISSALFDLSKAQPSIPLTSPNAMQHQLDDWASPTGDVEQSMHYQMVIAPFLAFFHTIATGRDASTVS